uniref:Major facilitator superfamily (MFS) profile domain-containing protein n=1 Tax=Chaetoceros debilis TaxID=122233 RepID=A0A7S3VA17_9STRA|mmetsp:Transcript_9894/g.14890  ORF Transcript_9894/g.14890 Transcript_9894/m.14890 type:complete len:723 (+) Transcript_9894:775-2943(+)|eukprot:CAMPEP_0194111882 /NCGR_PEP_ID=MMETSP0150-20130528/10780_1 /TAXON_ID=122233 /ORGANISM="Chaetoceros debilis, Strain MM31A-1" /LENGTH=722 /DNA_ID=CAMNT_0038801423 /DNA_START=729 /DNA_END=2897 /DNA_ORIENTATION=+
MDSPLHTSSLYNEENHNLYRLDEIHANADANADAADECEEMFPINVPYALGQNHVLIPVHRDELDEQIIHAKRDGLGEEQDQEQVNVKAKESTSALNKDGLGPFISSASESESESGTERLYSRTKSSSDARRIQFAEDEEEISEHDEEDMDIHMDMDYNANAIGASCDSGSTSTSTRLHTASNRPRMRTYTDGSEGSIFLTPTIDEDDNDNDTCCCHGKSSWCSDFKSFFSFDGNSDAKACALVKIPEAAAWVASSVYLSTVFVKFAYIEAGCAIDIPDGETVLPECNGRIYGIKPSSILTVFVMALGVITALFLPIVGALLDSSNWRRAVGAITGVVLCVITLIQSFVSEEIWFPIFVLQLFSSVILTVNVCVALAYLPELTQDKSELARYNTVALIFFNSSVVVYLIAMTVVSSLLSTSDNDLASARVALLTVFVLQIIFYGISWFRLFTPRASRALRDCGGPGLGAAQSGILTSDTERLSESKCSCGIVQNSLISLKRTITKAFRQRSEVRYFLIYRAITYPANAALIAATISYVNEQIQISSRDLGIAVLIILACAIPGNRISLSLMEKFDPLRSLKLCILIITILPCMVSILVSEPGHEYRLYLVSILWGLLLGWKEPSEKTVLCNLIPPGIEAEMMGLYVGAGQLMMWMSPLIFTVMNENGVNLRIAIASFGVYFLLGFLSLLFMGTFEDVTEGTKSHEKEDLIEHEGEFRERITL